ncbi:MAG: glycosyltransferase [Lachnospiraceae bacterium]|nr:glycosyltransferase [Lachnospiraceae bacterium]
MKILYLVNVPSPYRVDFLNELGKLCDLTVLFETRKATDRDEEWVADKITNFKAVFMKGIRQGVAEAFCPGVIKYIRRGNYDLVVVQMYSSLTGMYAIQYMKSKKIPFVINSDGGVIKQDAGLKFKLKRYFLTSARACLSTGRATDEYLMHYGVKRDNIYIYPFTSVREAEILKSPISVAEKKVLRDKLGMKEERIILSVGQFIHRKGYDLLLKTCGDLSDNVGIYIVGGVPSEEYLRMKDELGLTHVHFIPFMTRDKLRDYYLAADMFVLPTREDIWGLVVNEALACGLPVITTDCCNAGLEMLGDGRAGRIVELNCNWSEEIRKLFDSDDFDDMPAACIEVAKNYSIERMAARHLEIFKELTGAEN